MDIKPSDIFIGVIDFFSVILPGALLTYFLAGMFYGQVFGEGRIFAEPMAETTKWMIFLLVTYIVGNLIFMLASLLDSTYDRSLRRHFFQSKYDLEFKTARLIREKHIETDKKLAELLAAGKISQTDFSEILKNPNREIFNTFKWAQHFLLFNQPEALDAVQRIVADSKFFRSLVVTFLIITVLLAVQFKFILAIIFFVLAAFCYYRYGELRYKSTEKAYELLVTFFHQKLPEKVDKPAVETVSDDPPISVAVLRNDISNEFSTRHRELILSLTKGFAKPFKQITFVHSEDENKVFVADKNEEWFCVEGRGILQSNSTQTILIPEAIVPMKKGGGFSVKVSGNQPLEILSLETV